MTNSEVRNFASQTLDDLDRAYTTAGDYQCMLPLTMPRLKALERILTYYVLNHFPLFDGDET